MRWLSIILAMVWVWSGVGVAVNSDVSPAFLLNTLTPGGTGNSVSLAFVLNTLTPGATGGAVSGAFTVNTRGPTGLSGSRVSGGFVVDTRTVGLTTLILSGPGHVDSGHTGQFTCTANYTGLPPEDVTTTAAWSIVGGPAGASVTRGLVTAGTGPGSTARITASMQRSNGQRTSVPFDVTIGTGLRVQIPEPTVTLLSRTGQNFQWRVQAVAVLSAPVANATYLWRWKNAVIPGQTGSVLDTTIGGSVGSGEITVVVNAPGGVSGLGYRVLTLNKPSVGNEGVPRQVSGDVEEGFYLDAQGGQFVFDQIRANQGLIVMTHGLLLNDDAQGQRDWLEQMADIADSRILVESGAAKLPNIAIYDWLHDARASQDLQGEEADRLVVETIRKLGPELLGQTTTEKAEKFYKSLLNQERFNPNLAFAYGAVSNALSEFKPVAREVIVNVILSRSRAQQHGQFLAKRLLEKVVTGDVNAQKPIHLIGHSAGGFVVGECAQQLKLGGYAGPILVTMLDTPFPFAEHAPKAGSGIRVERYISSIFGKGAAAREWDADSVVVTPSGTPGLTSFVSVTPKIPPSCDYHRFEIPDRTRGDWVNDHANAHVWYFSTIQFLDQENGFFHSPFGGDNPWSCAPATPALSPPSLEAPPPPPGPFLTYGSVTSSAGEFVLTEQDNAGIYLETTLPVGASKLKFEYQFTTGGDGDFLQVFAGEGAPLFTGSNTDVSRAVFIPGEISVAPFAGESVRFDFKLVSRGVPSAVLRIRNIQLETDDDLDGDGLSNDAELAAGSSPWHCDTDEDGLSDSYESIVSHTNPLLADSDGDGVSDFDEIVAGTNSGSGNSVFSIKSIAPAAGGGVALSWTGRSGSTYRVLRSATPDFASFDVIAAAVPGIAPLTSFMDVMVDARQLAGMFYRVEVAEAPAYAANMNGDSDGDGLPDGWELDRGFNADLAADALLDADGDGSSTLLEFALGTDPRVNSHDGIGIYTDENGYLTLITNRNPAASGLPFRIAVSGDLAAWSSDAAHVTILSNTPTLLKARDNLPPGSAARRFIRLEVVR